MTFEIPKEIVSQAESFWDDEGIPLLRPVRSGEQILILGWSLAQEMPVLLSREAEGDEDYQAFAREAVSRLPDDFPDSMTCEGEVVCEVGYGFYDVYGDRTTEITFLKLWHATLLQYWLDAQGVPICIRPSRGMEDEKIISDHAYMTHYSFDRSIRYAAFKDMSIRYAIRCYVDECWRKDRKLPTGSHTLANGVVVTFPKFGA